MDFLAYPIHLIVAHPFGYMAVVIVWTIAMAIFSKGPKNKLQRWLYIGLFAGIPFSFILAAI